MNHLMDKFCQIKKDNKDLFVVPLYLLFKK